jgi:ribosomal protein L22
MAKYPKYKDNIENYETEYSSSLWDGLPNVIKDGYNRSLQGMAHEIATGKKRFDLGDYDPSVIEDIGAEVASFFAPADFALTVATGGIGSVAGKKVLSKFVFKKLMKNGVKSAVARNVANKSVASASRGIASGIGAGATTLGVYGGAGDALRQKLETGVIQKDKVVKSTAKGFVLGGITTGVGGFLSSRGASTLTKVAAEIGAFGTGAPLMEGEIPTPQDYIHTAGMIIGIKGVHKLLKAPVTIEAMVKRGSVFEMPKATETIRPSDKEGEAYLKAQVKTEFQAQQAQDVWRSRDGKTRVFISDVKGDKYHVVDLVNKQSKWMKKDKFHSRFQDRPQEMSSAEFGKHQIDSTVNLESALGYDKKSAHIKRMKFANENLQGAKDILLEHLDTKGFHEYNKSLQMEKRLADLGKDFKEKGWDVPLMPTHNMINKHLPKWLAEGAKALLPAKNRSGNPLYRKFIADSMVAQDLQVKLMGKYLTKMHNLPGDVLNMTNRKARALTNKITGKRFKSAQEYLEHLTERKENKGGVEGRGLRDWDLFTDQLFKEAADAGIQIPGYIKNYVPKMLKKDVANVLFSDILSIQEKGVKMEHILEVFDNDGNWIKKNPREAQIMNSIILGSIVKMKPEIRKIIENNMKSESGEYSALRSYAIIGREIYNNIYNPFGNLENKRRASLPKEYYERNMGVLMANYATRVAKRIAQVEIYGDKGQKFNALADKVIASGDGKTHNMMREVYLHMTGLIEHDREKNFKPTTKKWIQGIMAYETATKISLGFATIPNLTQFTISTAVDAGYLRTIRGAYQLATNKEVRKRIEQSGATNYSMILEMMGINQATSRTSKVVDGLSKLTGFTQINKFNQRLAAATAGVFVKDLHKMAKSGFSQKRRNWAKEKLKELGVDSTKELTNSDVKTAMERFARKSQLQKDILEDPLIFNNPQTRLFTQFKRFGYRQYQLSRNLLVNDFKRGNIMPILRLAAGGVAGGMFVGLAKQKIKELLSGEASVDPQQMPKEFEDIIEAISAVGAFGVVGDIMSASVEEGKSVSRAIKFATTPPFLDDIDKFFNRFLFPMEKDFETFQEDAFRRAPIRLLRLQGGVLREVSKHFETKGMTIERIKTMRKRVVSDVITKLVDARSDQDYDSALALVRNWNSNYEDFPITGDSINNKAIYRRKMRKYKRQALEN